MKFTVLCLALATTFSSAAHAGFTVDEDAPQITAVAQTPILPQVQRVQGMNLDVTFVPQNSWINIAGKNALKLNLDELRAAEEVRITTFTTKPRNFAIQRLRGRALTQWLTANGIPANKITVTDSSEFFHDDPSANTATITIMQNRPAPIQARSTIPQSTPSLRYAKLTPQETGTASPTLYQPTPTGDAGPTPLINDKVRLALVQKIVSMAQNKLVKPEDVVNMIAEVLKMQDPSSPALSPTIAPIVAIDFPRAWTLDNKKSLRENVEDWARIAKWEAPEWHSNTSFEFPYATLNGTFLDALGQLAKAVPSLDFKANRTYRTLSVVDNRTGR